MPHVTPSPKPRSPHQDRVSRRALLLAGAAGTGSLLLAACSGDGAVSFFDDRSEEATGHPPTPVPDEAELLAALERVRAHRTGLAAVVATGSAARTVRGLDPLWQLQHERLVEVVRLSGIELSAEDMDTALATTPDPERSTATAPAQSAGPDSSSATATAAPDATPALAPEDVADRIVSELPAVLSDITTVSTTNRPMLLALAAQHADAARRLGRPVDWPELVGPTDTAAVPVLAAARPAVYGLEVLAARSEDEERERYQQVLTEVRALTRSLTTLAGDAAPLPPLGYGLGDSSTERSGERSRLATALVSDIAVALLGVADRIGDDEEQARAYLRVLADTVHWRRQLEADPEPFPGMVLP